MNYYNEFDPFAAAWLRNLIADGLVPAGDVDDRSIADVRPTDLAGYVQCHFFAGIGGWSYALHLAGWPEDQPVWTGSCPCQPFSVAGRGAGTADERHLWPAFRDLIAECRPPVVLGEQVAAAAGRLWLTGVRADLEELGYAVGAADLCAAGVGAPHIRQRLYWLAQSTNANGRAGERGAKTGVGADAQRRGRLGERGTPGGVGDAIGERGRGGELRHEDASNAGLASEAAGGLGDANGAGRETLHPEPLRSEARSERSAESGSTGGLGHAVLPRLEGHAGDGNDGDESGWLDEDAAGPTSSPGPSGLGEWADSDFIDCGDGRQRRVPLEPALFPLAARLPNRVGILRGAGNAIVPPLAAEFVMAYMDSAEPPG